ncbi:DNA-directed RNA polymerase subunit beta' [endosymbiont of Euscepes postfasciatus]|uniref:DNA-directed RNA polymerase subunit beta' n=1 Tax=endosymbiont of Euscepes postfasciatus TaxID=650377 RepID=UPI000DC6DD6C|nr:DNA-directed RNA polymerase subunit beta' [endosymbiont of Euscepes postfasciatus]BBA84698.1 DNA-directed RNA polymerase subunit beta' [endosymbiont of Euscepes postfasciatus]
MNNLYKKFNSIKLSIASPDIIRSWSYGEVKKPETINYRTFKPERDGLFCSKIFGPIKDYECLCGKYKKVKFKGIKCEKCGVEIIESKVRRIRMGHIELSSPVAHIWFLRSLPSKIGLLLDMSIKDIEKVLYFESYIITKSNNNKFPIGKIISEKEFLDINNFDFEVKMGAEAIQILLKNINLQQELIKLNKILSYTQSDFKNKRILKRIDLIKSFINSNNKPDWMILNVLPILPPDLRPLVPLDGGRFATSDLNDLYRRVINRNNRLRKLINLSAPDIIIKNEKRMLQESVDSLLDNSRQDKTISSKRHLKSLSDMIKGKHGRFRQNLLGKRVDYSGRSVITVGPYLKLNQCGIPKEMALELFKPFIYNKLIENGISNNLKSSKKIVDSKDSIVWDVLLEIIKDYPILLNRAPTLHRLGIQSFYPILIEGKSIQLHPLVCTAYNADFDGDQMAIHIPISIESKIESKILMMSTNNILSPSNGDPVIIPSQDIIIGIYYLTVNIDENIKYNSIFSNLNEVKKYYDMNIISIHTNIKVRILEIINNEEIYNIVSTTVGRILLWDFFPKKLRFNLINKCLRKKDILNLINISYKLLGIKDTIKLIDNLMYIGFIYASKSGISVSLDDLVIPDKKFNIINKADIEVENIQNQYKSGLLSNEERYNKIINIWLNVSEEITTEMINNLSKYKNSSNYKELLNSIFIMYDSGARGSSTQIRQLSGIRGLMTKPDGSIIENPIKSNFKEGLDVFQYFISTHGARKGLADTALKTANSGYLTRRLVDVAQDLVITKYNCNTKEGIYIYDILENEKIKEEIYNKIFGRFIINDICINNKIIIRDNTIIDSNICNIIEFNLINKLKIRSVIMCDNEFGICSVCYGIDLSNGNIVSQGESVGVIAAQSIGEPGTQLTMRTFHIGGAAFSNSIIDSNIYSKYSGILDFNNLKYVKNKFDQFVVISKNSEIKIFNNNELQGKYKIPYGSIIYKMNNDFVKSGDLLIKYDPYYIPIISNIDGRVKFKDIIVDKTVINKLDEITGIDFIMIIDYHDRLIENRNFLPTIEIINSNNESYQFIIPDKSIIQVHDNEYINCGDIIAKIPQNKGSIKEDITGGLPRISDLFEVRNPKNQAILAEENGIIFINNLPKGKRKIIIKSIDNNKILYETIIPKWKNLQVLNESLVEKGDIISDGQASLNDILRLRGLNKLINFMIDEIQSIYKLQGVKINDKHIEIIIKQMLKKVLIIDPGESFLNKNDSIEFIKVKKINYDLNKKNKKNIKYQHILLGITKSSLITDSFISSASFQETTRVLTESSILGKIDFLKGLKENVIVGRLIPAGTGYIDYQKKMNFEK